MTPPDAGMFVEFPYDRACEPLDEQYMMGDALLAAPVFKESGEVEYYLPKGCWYNLLTGRAKARRDGDTIYLHVEGGSQNWKYQALGDDGPGIKNSVYPDSGAGLSFFNCLLKRKGV